MQGLSGLASSVWCGVDNTFITLKHDGSVEALGFNNFGQLGSGNQTDSRLPVRFGKSLQGIKEITGGQTTTCLVSAQDQIMCVGSNALHQLGSGESPQALKYTLDLVQVINLPVTEASTSSPTTTSTGTTINASLILILLCFLT